MKLFQIEEPDGSPAGPDQPGAAIGIDLTGRQAQVAIAVGGNAALLADREGFEQTLPVPSAAATGADWQDLLEGVRLRAERALARPVTHAVIALAGAPEAAVAETVGAAAEAAGLKVLRLLGATGEQPALAAACLAEDLAPRD